MKERRILTTKTTSFASRKRAETALRGSVLPLALTPLGRDRTIRYSVVEDRPGHDRRYAIDAGQIRQELAWEPQENFASGLVYTVQWYLKNSQWVERVTSGTYRRERLGLAAIKG